MGVKGQFFGVKGGKNMCSPIYVEIEPEKIFDARSSKLRSILKILGVLWGQTDKNMRYPSCIKI